jgi:uncharacterized protein (TIGR00725 family)
VERRKRVAVIGAGAASADDLARAEQVGAEIARHGAILICGGLGGCMEAAARGARSAGGTTIGLLPGYDAESANREIEIPLPTGLGQARNVLVVASADAVVAIAGGPGTLSEMALALKLGRRLVGLGTWQLQAPDGTTPPILRSDDPREAVQLALGKEPPADDATAPPGSGW